MARYSVLSIVSGALIFAMSATIAQAAPPPQIPISCGTGSVLITLPGGTADLTTSTNCEVFDGDNDTQAIVAANDPFGITDWVLADKSDATAQDDLNGEGGDHAIILKDVINDVNSGSWSVDSFNGYTDVFLTLKAGNAFVAYLLDTAFLSGDWATSSVFPSGDGGKDLSHMSLYYSPDSLTAVPLPAALPLYAAGVAILGFLGYRRRKA